MKSAPLRWGILRHLSGGRFFIKLKAMKNLLLPFLIFPSMAFAESFVLKENNFDLNHNKQKDSIVWYTDTKGSDKPTNLQITMDGNAILGIGANFCKLASPPSADCVHLEAFKKTSSRREDLIELKNTDSDSTSVYTYRLNKGSYTLVSANYKSESERSDINYLTGRAVVTSKKQTISKVCSLKNTRKNEKISEFNLFSISDEAICE